MVSSCSTQNFIDIGKNRISKYGHVHLLWPMSWPNINIFVSKDQIRLIGRPVVHPAKCMIIM